MESGMLQAANSKGYVVVIVELQVHVKILWVAYEKIMTSFRKGHVYE
jgi:hypothetical protein